MTVTTSVKGKYKVYVSGASTTANVITELAQALSDDGIKSSGVIYFNSTDKTAVAEVGR